MFAYIVLHMLGIQRACNTQILVIIVRQHSLFKVCSPNISVAIHFSAVVSKKVSVGFLQEFEKVWA